jgi:hypothetical protein
MSKKENEKIIDIKIPEEFQADYVSDLADFIEKELRPPSRVWWILFFFALGVAAGFGLGVAIWWVK